MAMKQLTGKASSISAGILYGALVSVAITLAMSGLLAKMIQSEWMPWSSVGYGIMAFLLLASFWGAFAACRKIKRRRLLVSFMSGGTYFAILIGMTALFFGGQYDGVWVTAFLIIGGSICAAMFGNKEKRGGKRTNKTIYSR